MIAVFDPHFPSLSASLNGRAAYLTFQRMCRAHLCVFCEESFVSYCDDLKQ